MLDRFDQLFQVRQNRASHKNGDLLNDSDACVSCFPALLAGTNGFQKWQERTNSEGTGNNGKSPGGCISDELFLVINIRPHYGDHCWQTSGFREVTDDLSSFNSGVVILIDEHGLDHYKNFMNEGSDQIIQFVKDSVDDFDEQMPLLWVLVCHQQGQNMVEKRTCPKLPCVYCDLPQC